MRTYGRTGTDDGRPRRRWQSAGGVSLVEMLIVVFILALAAAFAVPTVQTALLDMRANAAARALQGHLRTARDAAVGRRRVVELRLTLPNAVFSNRLEGSGRTLIGTTVFEGNMRYHLNTELPDTPDALGAGSALAFDGADATTSETTMYFQPDGSLTDSGGLPISGTAFLGDPERSLTTRAVTVMGPSGRAQAYRWDGAQWRKMN